MVNSFTSYKIEDRSYLSYIKREIHQSLIKRNFSDTQVGEIDIVVAEITSNLIKYAGSGELLYRTYDIESTNSVFEILCLDKGVGMADVHKMSRDGFSTSSTLGQGLGAIERLSSLAQFYSIPSWGTVIYSQKSTLESKPLPLPGSLDITTRTLLVNKTREAVCGDGYFVTETPTHYKILFGDGLGHGQFAHEAVETAKEIFAGCAEHDPVDILRLIHEKVRRTRGLVGTVAVCDKRAAQWRVCGVGNILTRMYSGIQYKNYMAYNGTIGLNIPNSMNSSTFPLERNQYLIMCSDGINTRWDTSKYPHVFKYDNMILAACIYKDFNRGTDDASVLIAKVN